LICGHVTTTEEFGFEFVEFCTGKSGDVKVSGDDGDGINDEEFVDTP
jgi:hypothetical protein